MTTAAVSAFGNDFLRVESVFARTYDFIRRQGGLYLFLVLLLGAAPSLLFSYLTGTMPGDLTGAALPVRVAAMAVFMVTDAALCALLAKATLDVLVGRPASLRSALDIAPHQWGPLFVVTALMDAPMLALNLISSQVAHETTLQLILYGARFAVGITLGALWCGAAAIVLVDSVGP